MKCRIFNLGFSWGLSSISNALALFCAVVCFLLVGWVRTAEAGSPQLVATALVWYHDGFHFPYSIGFRCTSSGSGEWYGEYRGVERGFFDPNSQCEVYVTATMKLTAKAGGYFKVDLTWDIYPCTFDGTFLPGYGFASSPRTITGYSYGGYTGASVEGAGVTNATIGSMGFVGTDETFKSFHTLTGTTQTIQPWLQNGNPASYMRVFLDASALLGGGGSDLGGPITPEEEEEADDATQAAASGPTQFVDQLRDAVVTWVKDQKNYGTAPGFQFFESMSELWEVSGDASAPRYPGAITADFISGLIPDVRWGGDKGLKVDEGIVAPYLGSLDQGMQKVRLVLRSAVLRPFYTILTSFAIFLFCLRRAWGWITWALFGSEMFAGAGMRAGERLADMFPAGPRAATPVDSEWLPDEPEYGGARVYDAEYTVRNNKQLPGGNGLARR